MIWPFETNTDITSDFKERRPLNADFKTHIHGAVDVKGCIGDIFVSPEPGDIMYMMNLRDSKQAGKEWPDTKMRKYPFVNYFYDMYGGVVLLKGISGKMHVFCHIYKNQMDRFVKKWNFEEEKLDRRFPFMSFFSDQKFVDAGADIGYFGNAGYSTGCHVHYEIHKKQTWTPHKNRINPEEVKWHGR